MSYHCGNNLKLIREIFNYTQIHVAHGIGICDKTYREMEHAMQPPSPHLVQLLNKFYNIELNHFLQLTQEEILSKPVKT